MQTINKKISTIQDLLKQLSPIVKENSSHYIIRCPYCGDSKKNPNHCHFYIQKQAPFLYHCFRAECEASGNLWKLLQDFDLIQYVTKDLLKQVFSQNTQKLLKIRNNHYILQQKLAKQKIDLEKYDFQRNYLLSRLVYDEIPQWLERFIVYDIKDYIQGINHQLINSHVFENLNKYVGFLSYHYSFINCRLAADDNDLPRYYKITINEDKDFFMTFPNSDIRFLDTKGIIILGEGIFDVVNGYYHLLNHNIIGHDETNVILIANGGKSFANSLSFILKKFGVYTWDKYFLLDKDFPSWYLKYQLKGFSFMKHSNNFILYNEIGKDFGEIQCKPKLTKLTM